MELDLMEVLIPLLVYFVPIAFFVYMGIDVPLRNARKVEHRLLSIITLCYVLLFLGEYVRHQLDIAYSPLVTGLWFSNIGVLIPGLGFHFLVKFAQMDKKMPRFLYPYVFYAGVIVIAINLWNSGDTTSVNHFVQTGMWKTPLYNAQYYVALSVGLLISAAYLIPLYMGRRQAEAPKLKSIYNLMICGVLVVIGWHVVFGYFQFGRYMPPYPYLYAGAVWCFILRLAMIRYDFLNFIDKRYEKLFHMNPTAILLVDASGRIREANPSARQLFHPVELDRVAFGELFSEEVSRRIWRREEIKALETTIYHQNTQIDLLLDGDYLFVDHEPQAILILRDLTAQKASQREIMFLAYYDSLTRLPNRRYFYEQLEAAIQEAAAQHSMLAVILIDLNHFKETNDRWGHRAGDRVLQHVAGIIEESVAGNGMAARLGGDEFVMFIRGVPSRAYAQEIVVQLQDRFKERELLLDNERLPVEMSIGVSLYPADGEDGDALVNSADKAMYEEKRNSRIRSRSRD